MTCTRKTICESSRPKWLTDARLPKDLEEIAISLYNRGLPKDGFLERLMIEADTREINCFSGNTIQNVLSLREYIAKESFRTRTGLDLCKQRLAEAQWETVRFAETLKDMSELYRSGMIEGDALERLQVQLAEEEKRSITSSNLDQLLEIRPLISTQTGKETLRSWIVFRTESMSDIDKVLDACKSDLEGEDRKILGTKAAEFMLLELAQKQESELLSGWKGSETGEEKVEES